MWVILKQSWCDFPVGHKVAVSDTRAYALLDAGIAAEVEKPRPKAEPKDELAEALGMSEEAPKPKDELAEALGMSEEAPKPKDELAEALGMSEEAPKPKAGRPRKK